MRFEAFHVHGDNIVECERALNLIVESFSERRAFVKLSTESVLCPQYELFLEGPKQTIPVVFFPGFGRWDHNILDSIRRNGGVLREAADAIITGVLDGKENLLLAVEFCGALPAGNQAWQRSGRAYSFGRANLPYLYISELGGFELNTKRQRKAARLPNPAVPFSYLAFSIENKTPVIPIFLTAPGADAESRDIYSDSFAGTELKSLINRLLSERDVNEILIALESKVANFVALRASNSRGNNTLSKEHWQTALSIISDGGNLVDFLASDVRTPWSKTAYIADLTDTAKSIMLLGAKYGFGLTSGNLPLSLIPSDHRKHFAQEIEKLVPSLNPSFLSWLYQSKHLAVCWVMGFKPRGDDARPDRGLPPMARMLVGKQTDLLTFVYGPAPSKTWDDLQNAPQDLASRNGLWEAILESTDALLVDSATQSNGTQAFISDHWASEAESPNTEHGFAVTPKPTKIGENDVDTTIHLLLSTLMGDFIFEGMCNPPGGDWSGVSIQAIDQKTEYRWVSLPRVSADGAKRPDHVFQIIGALQKPVILSVESKETAKSLEAQIGPRLNDYLTFLFTTGASISREHGQTNWEISDEIIDPEKYLFASAGAFLQASTDQVQKALERSKTDMTFVVDFSQNDAQATVTLWSQTPSGKAICEFLMRQKIPEGFIKLEHKSTIQN